MVDFVASIEPGFAHNAAIFNPVTLGPNITQFCAMIPASEHTRMCASQDGRVRAATQNAPIIIIGNDTLSERLDWDTLCERARRYDLSIDKLLADRPIRIACTTWKPQSRTLRLRFHGERVLIRAVKIMGDFKRSTVLDEHVASVKSWFDDL